MQIQNPGFDRETQLVMSTDRFHDGLDIGTRFNCNFWYFLGNVSSNFRERLAAHNRVLGGMTREGTKQAQDLNTILMRIFPGQTSKRVDPAETHREHIAPQHFRTFLVAFVQQPKLGCTDLPFRNQTAP